MLVESAWEAADAVALAPAPDDAGICMAEAERLMAARDRISCALSERVGRVHRAGEAKRHGHASTRSWLRTSGGMTTTTSGRLLTLAVELARLPRVREAFTKGTLAAGVVEAICTAISGLTDDQARLAEPILLELAGKAGPAEVAKAGRYLRAVLDPDGEERDEQADYTRRFLRVRPGAGGGMEGEFYLPREAAARLRALLDAYAKPKAEGDDRPLRVRYADAFIALLEDKIVTELLVLVSAESLPTDPEPADPATEHPARDPEADRPESTGHPEGERPDSTDRPETGHPATDPSESTGHPATGNPGSADRPAVEDSAATGPATDHPEADHREDIGETQNAHAAEDVSASDGIGSCEAPDGAVDPGGSALGEAADTVDPAWNSAGNHPDPTDDFATAIAGGNPGGAGRSATLGTCCPTTGHPETSSHLEAGHTGSVERSATPEAGRADSGERWEDAQNAEAIEDSETTEKTEDGRDAETAQESRRATTPADHAENTRQQGHTQEQGPRSGEPRWGEERRSCNPPGDTCAHHAHAGPRPAGEVPHGPGHAARLSSTPKAEPKGSPAPGPEASTQSGAGDPAGTPSGTASRSGSSARTGTASGTASRAGVGAEWGAVGAGLGAAPGARSGTRLGSRMGAVFESAPGAGLGAERGAGLGAAPGAEPGSPRGSEPGPGPGSAGLGLGVVPGLVPGLLLATGQVLPVSSVHRLARTSTLVRIVMDAQGQVLDMGRKVRLATPAQRRAIFARYATCWVDGCPLPATLCQIDHADNWSSGGLTDLKLLGPACQFHNRDRYRHPERYTRRKVGKDRWAFTYHRLGSARRL
ncbi:hypothetical protein GCM10010116_18510 [Microbispora rosea subsp. aerata]|nr:hypothetical protein GCM10010116_18510 [Microbispora rosea subsp. aerata]